VIKFYGTPLSPIKVFKDAMKGRNCLIPFPNPQDQFRADEICNGKILDNGAFTVWRKGIKIDWNKYYDWVGESRRDFFFIPDVIDGTEEENDALLKDNHFPDGVPIWHLGESFDRLSRLAADYDLIAFGSSGKFKELGTFKWHRRMHEAMDVVCDKVGKPLVDIHMLRCLNPAIFTRYPFFSGDSTGLAQNHSRDGWENIVNRIEPYNSPERYGELGGLFA